MDKHRSTLFHRFLSVRELPAGALFLVVFAILTASRPDFLMLRDASGIRLNTGDLLDLARQYAELGMIAVALTLVIATGGIDISVGSIVGATSVILGVLSLRLGMDVWPAALCALSAAAAIGAVNGLAVARLNLQPVVVTLAAMSAARGLAYVLSGGMSMSGFPESFTMLGRSSPWNLAVPLGVLTVTMIGGHVTLVYCRFGRALLAAGANEQAARLSGVAVARVKTTTYLLTAIMSGIAGILTTARVVTAVPDAGLGYEFEAITAVVMGGTSLRGGEATVVGTLFGVATMAVLRRGLNLIGATDIWKMFFLGVVLIGAVGLDILRNWLTSRIAHQE